MLAELMMIAGARQAPYQTRVGRKYAGAFMPSWRPRRGNPWSVPRSRCAVGRSGVSEAHAASSAAIHSARRRGGAVGQPRASTDRRGAGRATRDRPCTDLVAWARRSLLVILPRPSRVPRPEAMPALTGERRAVRRGLWRRLDPAHRRLSLYSVEHLEGGLYRRERDADAHHKRPCRGSGDSPTEVGQR